jgi:hypothetical protein
MTRRRLLKALFFFALGTVTLVFLWRSRRLRRMVTHLLRPRVDSSSPTGKLSEDEKNNLVAFAEVLVEGRTLSIAERGYLIEHIDYRTGGTPGYLSLYRMTASLLDRLAHTRFSTLDLHNRKEVMTHHRLTSYDVRMREYLLPFYRPELAVRMLAVPDLITGYYRSPAGWAVVGYEAFPGRCSNLIRYTRPEG